MKFSIIYRMAKVERCVDYLVKEVIEIQLCPRDGRDSCLEPGSSCCNRSGIHPVRIEIRQQYFTPFSLLRRTVIIKKFQLPGLPAQCYCFVRWNTMSSYVFRYSSVAKIKIPTLIYNIWASLLCQSTQHHSGAGSCKYLEGPYGSNLIITAVLRSHNP